LHHLEADQAGQRQFVADSTSAMVPQAALEVADPCSSAAVEPLDPGASGCSAPELAADQQEGLD